MSLCCEGGVIRMGELFAEMLGSLREGQRLIDQELYPRLQEQDPDWAMLTRLRDVADEHAERARQLRQMMTERADDADQIEEVDRMCEYFEGAADLIAQETGDAEDAATPPVDENLDRE